METVLIESQTEIEKIFHSQQKNKSTVGSSTVRERIEKLKKLHAALLQFQADLEASMYADFKKHPTEVVLTEIFAVQTELKHVIKHLKSWMRPQKVATPITLLGTSSAIYAQPKGVVLIISPWNFPINLTLCPLVSAVAAGNCVMIKPSEITPHTSAILKKMIESVFEPSEVAVLEGNQDVAAQLLDLPFNHIFFTGSPAIGKIVMQAAAKNLTSVTLELGGKSPVVVDETADLEEAAGKIVMGKYLNSGQICISPDYLFVHESRKDDLIKAISQKIESFYGLKDQQINNPDYARIVNNRHFERVKTMLDDAVLQGASIAYGGKSDSNQNYISPTLLTGVHSDMRVLKEEIFGPLLPILSYQKLENVIEIINNGEKPLALYIFSKNSKNQEKIIAETRSGGICINDCLLHFLNNNLPFGGDNNSGIGKSHGKFGFDSFSNAKAVLQQHTRFSAMKLLLPPYTPRVQKLTNLLLKWF